MKSSIIAVVFCCIFSSVMFSNIFPYPTRNKMIISQDTQQEINDHYEKEEIVSLDKEPIKVLNLDWFEYMNTYFTKYVTVRVIDIYSMKEYFVQRMGGYNHADVQTIDAKNTNIFKEVYGSVWSWTRRPVWVEIDGKFYAGSTNGMPHGFDILETGEGGHTCIHFLMSKTHGTKRVDPEHQNCVKYAYENQGKLNEYLKLDK